MSSTSQIARVSNNDATLHCIYLGDGYYSGLGAALIGNTVVTEINYLCADSLTETTPANLERVLQFLQGSKSLQYLNLCCCDDRRRNEADVIEMNGHVVHAVSKSTRIDELSLSAYTHVPHEAMAHLLRHTKSITKLTFLLWENEAASHASLEDLAQALGANQTLQTLTLSFGPNPQESLVFILQKLALHPCLRSIVLNSCAYRQCTLSLLMASALAYMLGGISHLQELSISYYKFGIGEVKEFLRGLDASHSLVLLELHSVDFFGLETQIAFMEFVQALNEESALKELRIDTFSLSSAQIAAMLNGSSLRALSIRKSPRGDKLHDFCSEFQSGSIKIARLDIVFVCGYQEIGNCLAQATLLREFHIRYRLEVPNIDVWLKAMQENGSLWHASLPLIEGVDGPPMSCEQTSRFQTYCQRNQMLHMLLPSPLNHDDTSVDGAGIELFPHLLACASMGPRMGPNSILLALLALHNAIGLQHFGYDKRTQQSQPDEL
jgi:hypothetical protein